MRRIYLTACLALLLATGCQRIFKTPTPRPTPIASPSATPVAATLTPAPSATLLPPTPSPTPEPARLVDLGIPAGDTYSIRGTIVDQGHGLLYALGASGDASAGQGVLTVVDLSNAQVRASIPLPAAFIEAPQMALSANGLHLYIVDKGSAAGDVLLLVSTGLGPEPLGTVLGKVPDVTAMALDPAAERLYVAGQGGLRRLHARTLAEEARTDLPTPGPAFSIAWLTVNHQAGLLYATAPDSEAIAVYHLEDLRHEAGIAPGGHIRAILPAPHRDQTYVLTEQYQPFTTRRVAMIQGAKLSTRYWEPEPGWDIGQIAIDHATNNLLLLEDSNEQKTRSRIRIVDTESGQVRETVATPYLSWTYAGYPRIAFTYKGQLYSWRTDVLANEMLVAIRMQTGEPAKPIHLGIRLVNAALDEATGRLFVLDSTGTVRVLDTPALNVIATWPGVLDTGLGPITSAPLTVANGKLYVADFAQEATLVYGSATGELIAFIPKAGQITVDATRKRVFITRQGVYVVEGITYQITDIIQETVRKDPMLVVPGAIEAHYDSIHDLLFVIMSNNSPGSSAATWLQIYDGATLQRIERPIRVYQQFLCGLVATDKPDRIWVASAFPGTDLTAFTIDGELVTRLQGLGGPLLQDAARGQLYVVDWGGLVTVDLATANVIGYVAQDLTYAQFLVFDQTQHRLYTGAPDGAQVLSIDPGQTPPSKLEEADVLPLHPVQQLAIGADGTVLAVSYMDSGSVLGLLRRDGKGWLLLEDALPTTAAPFIQAASDTPGTFFAFSHDFWHPYGLFRSVDNGRSWQPAMRGLSDLRVRSLALSPQFQQDRSAWLLAGSSGLFRTRDAGQSWTCIAPISGTHIAAALTKAGAATFLVLAEDSENLEQTIVYAPSELTGNIQRIGVIPIPPYLVKALALSPHFASDGIALVATERYALLLSRDEGRSWKNVGPEPIGTITSCTIFFAPSSGSQQTIYVLVAESFYGGMVERTLFRSLDNGYNWQRATNLDPGVCSLAVAPDGQIWAGDMYGRVAPLDPVHLMWELVTTPAPTATPLPPLTPVPTPSLFPTISP